MKKKVLGFILLLFTLLLLSCRTVTKDVEDLKLSVDVMPKDKLEDTNLDSGKYWGEKMLNFDGIISDKISPNYGNILANIKTTHSSTAPSLLCVDEEKDIIYYVNYGNDNYIYQLIGSESTILLEKGTNCIQFWEGELYFLDGVDRQLSGIGEKRVLYKYNFNTKEITLVIDKDIVDFYITSDGIYFNSYQNTETKGEQTIYTIEAYYKSFEDDIPIINKKRYNYLKYKGYQVIPNTEFVGYDLENMDTLKKIKVSQKGDALSIVGEQLYFFVEDELYGLNLKTGKKFSVHLKEYANKLLEDNIDLKDTFEIQSYTVMNGKIYVVGTTYGLYCIDTETLEVTTSVGVNYGKSSLPPNVLDISKYPRIPHSYYIEKLFTSGNRLFALVQYGGKAGRINYEFVELIVENNDFYVVQLY